MSTPVSHGTKTCILRSTGDSKLPIGVSVRMNGACEHEACAALLPCYEPSRPLRSSGTGLRSVPSQNQTQSEQRSVSELHISGEKCQKNCRSAPSLSSFKSRSVTFCSIYCKVY